MTPRGLVVKTRAVNLTCEFRGGGGGWDVSRANEYKVCSGSWHHKQFMVCGMETVEGQKQKSRFLDLLRLSAL